MKYLYSIFAAVLFTASVFAQAPSSFKYQAVLRDASGNIKANANVSLTIAILHDSATATTPVYSETQSATTNAYGLVNLEIGSQDPGALLAIDWQDGPYFIKISVDGTKMGTSQLLSVPFALYAEKAAKATETDPVFTAHPAYGISSGDINAWNANLSAKWNVNNNNIYYSTGRVGINTTKPATLFDLGGGNNWDLANTEGDMRIGDSTYRIKFGVALGGGGAGASSIMQYGKTGGYNVLSLGSQGNNILQLNGTLNSAGIGTDNPAGKLEIKSSGSNPQLVVNQSDAVNYVRIRIQNLNTATNTRYWDIAGYISNTTAADDRLNFYNYGTGNVLGLGGNGALYINGDAGAAGQVLQSNGTTGAPTWVSSNNHYIGESYGGGVVFFVYDNGHHGLIAATTDQSTGVRWYAGTSTLTMANANGVNAGKMNTMLIIANQGYGDGATYAARICNEYSVTSNGVTYGDWYLPSKYELELMYAQNAVIPNLADANFWSSFENTSQFPYYMNITFGSAGYANKNYNAHVRAIRAF